MVVGGGAVSCGCVSVKKKRYLRNEKKRERNDVTVLCFGGILCVCVCVCVCIGLRQKRCRFSLFWGF